MWFVAKFSDLIGIKQKEIFLSLFKITSSCLNTKNYFPVRLFAAKALRMYSNFCIIRSLIFNRLSFKIEKNFGQLEVEMKTKFEINNMKNLFNLIELIDSTSEDTIHLVLEGILSLNKVNLFKLLHLLYIVVVKSELLTKNRRVNFE